MGCRSSDGLNVQPVELCGRNSYVESVAFCPKVVATLNSATYSSVVPC